MEHAKRRSQRNGFSKTKGKLFLPLDAKIIFFFFFTHGTKMHLRTHQTPRQRSEFDPFEKCFLDNVCSQCMSRLLV